MIVQKKDLESLLHQGKSSALAALVQYVAKDHQSILLFLLLLFNQSTKNAKVEDDPLLDILAQLSIEVATTFGIDKSSTILTDYSFYLEQIGDFRKGIRIGLISVELSQRQSDINLQRRAHSVLATHFIRICDFQMACRHLEIALKIAQKLKNPLFECAVLSNIAVLFNGMGLNCDSTRIAMKALSYPGNTPQLFTLQAFNAINILKSSRLIGDDITSDFSYRIACKKVKSKSTEKNQLLWAYFEYNRALYLIDRGKGRIAGKYIDRAFLKHSTDNNPRVEALLQTAKALCAFANQRPADIRKAKQTLKSLLHTTKKYPTHHEDVLRALIQVYASEKTLRGRRIGLFYAHQLRQYVLEENQVRFAFQIGDCLRPRTGHVGEPIDLGFGESFPIGGRKVKRLAAIDALDDVYLGLARARESISEDRFNNVAYSIAENWAVAAEFSTNSSGERCFRVGKLCGAIAFGLGLKPVECAEIELACRLHDIGKILFRESGPRKSRECILEDYRLREHTIVGARLLKCSSDPVLRMAANAAKHHHEWWNGSGYPDRLAGEAIPLEARICAIADAYDALTELNCDHQPWTHREAVQQICAMAGVQLDPALIGPFLKAVEEDERSKKRVTAEIDQSMERNQLARAKKKLLETIELVE